MKAITPVLPHSKMPEIVLAKDQPQYLQLPATPVTYMDGTRSIITSYQLTWYERIHLFITGRFWLEQITFGSPLQPQRPTIYEPLYDKRDGNGQ